MRKHFHLACMMGAAALLTACGGGGGSSPEPAATADVVPATATVSAEAYSQYAGSLAEDDLREPLPVTDLAPPASDTAEPAPVTR